MEVDLGKKTTLPNVIGSQTSQTAACMTRSNRIGDKNSYTIWHMGQEAQAPIVEIIIEARMV